MADIMHAFTYPEVETPNIIEDIHLHLYPHLSRKEVQDVWCASTIDDKKKLTVIVERLEFIENLGVLKHDIATEHAHTISSEPDNKGNTTVKNNFQCTYLNTDMSGVHLDIEALQIYLLITCIDTIAGQEQHKNAFQWLREKYGQESSIMLDSLEELEAEYQTMHGLSKRFRELFLSGTSEELKSLWLQNFAVVSLVAANNGQPGNINSESLKSWAQKDETEKLYAVVSELYNMRSVFTHKSSRQFLRTLPVEHLPIKRSKHLVRVGEQDLYELLLITVRELVSSYLASKGGM